MAEESAEFTFCVETAYMIPGPADSAVKHWPTSREGIASIASFQTHITGSLNYPCWGNPTIQICGNFEGFAL